MARVWSAGFEMQSVTAAVEFDTITGSGLSISTTTKRSGAAALRAYLASAGTTRGVFKFSSGVGVAYYRTYFYAHTLPSARTSIMELRDSGTYTLAEVDLNTNGTLQLQVDNSRVDKGSPSSALSVDTWYRIEFKVDTSVNGTISAELLLDGVSVATGSVSAAGKQNTGSQVTFGIDAANWGGSDVASADLFFDDIAVNDSSGSYQNSWPGSEKLIQLVPTATGDANAWLNNSGGAGATTDWGLVDEIPVNTTDYIESKTTNDVDLFNVTDSGIGASDVVNVVHVGVRYDGSSSSANSAFKVEIEKAASGTKAQSAAITPANTTWYTNAGAAPKSFPITEYLDPDNSVAWTQSTLDSMQIGVICSTGSTNYARVTTLWALVGYTPASGSAFTSSTVGTLATSGTLSKGLGKSSAGSLVSSGVVQKALTKASVGVLATSGVVKKGLGKASAGVLATSGVLTRSFGRVMSFAGTLVTSGILAKGVTKTFSGILATAGTLQKGIGKSFAGTLATAGTFVRNMFGLPVYVFAVPVAQKTFATEGDAKLFPVVATQKTFDTAQDKLFAVPSVVKTFRLEVE